MSSLLVRNLSRPVVTALKKRAAAHHRSLQQEVTTILERATQEPVREQAFILADGIRSRLAARRHTFVDSTPLLRADRRR